MFDDLVEVVVVLFFGDGLVVVFLIGLEIDLVMVFLFVCGFVFLVVRVCEGLFSLVFSRVLISNVILIFCFIEDFL